MLLLRAAQLQQLLPCCPLRAMGYTAHAVDWWSAVLSWLFWVQGTLQVGLIGRGCYQLLLGGRPGAAQGRALSINVQ